MSTTVSTGIGVQTWSELTDDRVSKLIDATLVKLDKVIWANRLYAFPENTITAYSIALAGLGAVLQAVRTAPASSLTAAAPMAQRIDFELTALERDIPNMPHNYISPQVKLSGTVLSGLGAVLQATFMAPAVGPVETAPSMTFDPSWAV